MTIFLAPPEAIAEGWNIFDCDGAAHRWQLQRIDDATDPAWIERAGGPVTQLQGDDAAWAIVAAGTKPYHAAARAWLKEHSPAEWEWFHLITNFKDTP